MHVFVSKPLAIFCTAGHFCMQGDAGENCRPLNLWGEKELKNALKERKYKELIVIEQTVAQLQYYCKAVLFLEVFLRISLKV